jgi:hypothetical protein
MVTSASILLATTRQAGHCRQAVGPGKQWPGFPQHLFISHVPEFVPGSSKLQCPSFSNAFLLLQSSCQWNCRSHTRGLRCSIVLAGMASCLPDISIIDMLLLLLLLLLLQQESKAKNSTPDEPKYKTAGPPLGDRSMHRPPPKSLAFFGPHLGAVTSHMLECTSSCWRDRVFCRALAAVRNLACTVKTPSTHM